MSENSIFDSILDYVPGSVVHFLQLSAGRSSRCLKVLCLAANRAGNRKDIRHQAKVCLAKRLAGDDRFFRRVDAAEMAAFDSGSFHFEGEEDLSPNSEEDAA